MRRKQSFYHFITLFILLIPLSSSHPGFSTSHPWSASFDASSFSRGDILHDSYLLFWNANLQQGTVTFAAVVKTGGWIGLGLSDNGGMKGADIALLLPQANGSFVLQDRISNDFVPPMLDASQDKVLDASRTRREGEYTSFVFDWKIKSCDYENDRDIVESEQWVIFAFSDSTFFSQHAPTNRGQAFISLLVDIPASPLPSDVQTLDVTSTSFTIPDAETTLLCYSTEIPLNDKNHVVRISPIIGHRNVHHINFYFCPHALNLTTPAVCSSEVSHTCDKLWFGWAKGELDFNTPLEAGFPIGGGDNNQNLKYILMEIHYDNSQREVGQVDPGSGFRLFYTPTLRPNDIGVLILGDYDFVIQPNTGLYNVTNRCPASCTQTFENPINLILTRFHMHEYGYSAKLRQVRGGVELSPLAEMRRYDFNLQNCVASPIGRQVLPGDTIYSECVWDSTGLTAPSRWGASSSDEMCRSFVYYYPRIDVGICVHIQSMGAAQCSMSVARTTNPADFSPADSDPIFTPFVYDCNYVAPQNNTTPTPTPTPSTPTPTPTPSTSTPTSSPTNSTPTQGTCKCKKRKCKGRNLHTGL